MTHFAGDVVYRTEGWLKKNTDTLHEDLQVRLLPRSHPMYMRFCLPWSTSPTKRAMVICLLSMAVMHVREQLAGALKTLPSRHHQHHHRRRARRRWRQARGLRRREVRGLQPRVACNRSRAHPQPEPRDSRLPRYARQLEDLMRTLRASHSHFVRCIKPNHQQEPHLLNSELVLGQLRNSGMVDAVRLLSAGYSTRLPFDTLEQMFKPLAPAKFQQLPPHIFCVALLSAFDLGRRLPCFQPTPLPLLPPPPFSHWACTCHSAPPAP